MNYLISTNYSSGHIYKEPFGYQVFGDCGVHYAYNSEYWVVIDFWFVQEEKLPYVFYVSDEELVVQLGSYLQKHKGLWYI